MTKTRRTVRQVMNATERLICVTAYDVTFARLVDEAGVDIILVGDSVAQAVQGRQNTLSVTLDEMVYHCECVMRAAPRALVVGDLPFLSFHTSVCDAVGAAGRLIKEGMVDAVKLEGGEKRAAVLRAIVEAEIPVMGHVGLTPQSYLRMGGYRVQGRAKEVAPTPILDATREQVIRDARAVEEAGAFALVIEGVPSSLAAHVAEAVSIPTIGIGASKECAGQILVINDLLGLAHRSPKFAKQYAALGDEVVRAVKEFGAEVRGQQFPSKDFEYD